MVPNRGRYCLVLLAGTSVIVTLGCTPPFTGPSRAESTSTQTYALPAGAIVRLILGVGSANISVNPSATLATVTINSIALAANQADANSLLTTMQVTITEPTPADNTLVIDAKRPAGATNETDQFHWTSNGRLMTVTEVKGSSKVAQYDVWIELPPNHGMEVTQQVGPIFAEDLDAASVLHVRKGTVYSGGARASLTAVTESTATGAGGIMIQSHIGSLDLQTDAGSLDIGLAGLGAPDHVTVVTVGGSIALHLPKSLNAQLHAQTSTGGISFQPAEFNSTSGVTQTLKLVEATLNNGGPNINVQTNRGSMAINGF